MRYPISEKLEIIRLVELSHLPVRRTLDNLGIAKTTFYRWYDRYLAFGEAAAACVVRRNVSEQQAAVHLLIEFWKEEAEENSVDHFHWINEDGYLSVPEMATIARVVWK